ncbi:unnamed protein product, partial [marine sediment metagenome]
MALTEVFKFKLRLLEIQIEEVNEDLSNLLILIENDLNRTQHNQCLQRIDVACSLLSIGGFVLSITAGGVAGIGQLLGNFLLRNIAGGLALGMFSVSSIATVTGITTKNALTRDEKISLEMMPDEEVD